MEQISIKTNNTNIELILLYLIDPFFQGINGPFVLLFENHKVKCRKKR